MYNKRAFQSQINHHRSDNVRGCNRQSRKNAWREKFAQTFNSPPANVRELDDKYELHLFAPGFEKGDFIIAIIDQTISISAEGKNDDHEEWKRLEYVPKRFKRQFELSEKIDKEGISAKYENGVLIISLTKLEGFETSRKEIEIV